MHWVAWLHLGLGSETQHEKSALEESGGGVPVSHLEIPDSAARKEKSHTELRKEKENQDRMLSEADRDGDEDRLVDKIFQRQESLRKPDAKREQAAKEAANLACFNALVTARNAQTAELRELVDLCKDDPSAWAEARANLVAHLKSRCPSLDPQSPAKELEFSLDDQVLPEIEQEQNKTPEDEEGVGEGEGGRDRGRERREGRAQSAKAAKSNQG
eukprot:2628589-Rhodomonas_salina.1